MTPAETRAIERCKRHEGLSLTVYECTENVWTIGYGHTGPDVHPRTPPCTREQADEWFARDWQEAWEDLNSLLWARRIRLHSIAPAARAYALVEMCFQLGPMHDFPAMLRALRRRDWPRVAAEMRYSDGTNPAGKRSDWWIETTRRCVVVSTVVETGLDEETT